jgi:hypothetical protein
MRSQVARCRDIPQTKRCRPCTTGPCQRRTDAPMATPLPVPPSRGGASGGWGGQHACRHVGEGRVLHPLAQPGCEFFDLMGVPAPPRCPSHVTWKTGAGSVCPGGRSHHGLRPLALMGTIGALIEFVVHLPGIFAAEPKRAPNLLQCRPMSYQAVKAFERIRTIFLLKLPLKFIRWLYVEFIAPVGHCRRAHLQQTGNLRIGERLQFDFGPNKLFDMGLIDFHRSSPCPFRWPLSARGHQHTLTDSTRRAPAKGRRAAVAVCRTVSAKGARHHPQVLRRRWFLTAQRAMLVPCDRYARCRPHPTPDAGAEGPQVLCLSPEEQQTLCQHDERKTQAMRIGVAQERTSGT